MMPFTSSRQERDFKQRIAKALLIAAEAIRRCSDQITVDELTKHIEELCKDDPSMMVTVANVMLASMPREAG